MVDEKYKNYLLDLGHLIREKALEAKNENDENGSDFQSGIRMAFYDVVSLMRDQAFVFEIPLDELGLAGLNPDVDLL
jgi:hypothetical protein